ncbi:hypothetical protein CSKR_109324 [Clonorchis sinensis]|uniref:Uncharacterized protein n=1 Tax=Clonorchis sinensis TaxID=79923 RepID=A0A3R7JTJ3_CLOSI|nr:hypothetical protein CSKR_109324 [Clonorchis sinensis]
MQAGDNKPSTMRDSLIRGPVIIKSSAVTFFWCLAAMQPEGSMRARILPCYPSLDRGSREAKVAFEPDPRPCAALFMKHWLCTWLECEFTDRKVRCLNPNSASRLPLSRLGQTGSIPALILHSGGMPAKHRKGATAERFFI